MLHFAEIDRCHKNERAQRELAAAAARAADRDYHMARALEFADKAWSLIGDLREKRALFRID